MSPQTKSVVAVLGVIIAIAVLAFSYTKFMGGQGPADMPQDKKDEVKKMMEQSMKQGGQMMLKGKGPGGPPMMGGMGSASKGGGAGK